MNTTIDSELQGDGLGIGKNVLMDSSWIGGMAKIEGSEVGVSELYTSTIRNNSSVWESTLGQGAIVDGSRVDQSSVQQSNVSNGSVIDRSLLYNNSDVDETNVTGSIMGNIFAIKSTISACTLYGPHAFYRTIMTLQTCQFWLGEWHCQNLSEVPSI